MPSVHTLGVYRRSHPPRPLGFDFWQWVRREPGMRPRFGREDARRPSVGRRSPVALSMHPNSASLRCTLEREVPTYGRERRYLGKGGFSVCYVFQDQATGERSAAKVRDGSRVMSAVLVAQLGCDK